METTAIQLGEISSSEHASTIHSLMQRAYTVEARLIGVTEFPPLTRSEKNIASAQSQFIAAFHDDRICGVIELEPAAASILISSLVIDPRYFRQGIARRLLQHSLQRHPEQDFVVETASKNLPALALYRSLNFKKVAELPTPEAIQRHRLVLARSS